MNDQRPQVIKHPITKDGLCGYDDHKQFWVYWRDDSGSLTGSIMADLRQHKCLLCKQGWKTCAVSLRDQYHSHEIRGHVHKTCYLNYLNFREHARMLDLFGQGGLYDHISKIEVLPNQYHGGWDTDWFNVTLEFPMKPIVQFGARRRVDSITIMRLSTPQRDAIWEVLGNENTTKEHTSDSFMIHAHNNDDVARYFRVFLAVLSPVPEGDSATAPAEATA